MENNDVEYWLQGPLPNFPAWLQPVAHALLQARKEINKLMKGFSDELLWEMPAGTASPAFHLQHITGVLDRMFTYADGRALTNEQLTYLSAEGRKEDNISLAFLLDNLNHQIESSISFLQEADEVTLTQIRFVGRQQVPSTKLGLLFHAAEHTMRHNGQLQVTVKVILNKEITSR